MNDHAALLRQHFLFQGAEELLSDALALGAERFSRGETICDPATAERALGIVLEGRAEAVAPTRERAVLAAFGPGDTFGAAALFGGEGYVSRIRAVTGCTVLLLPEALLRQWFARCPRMAVNYIAFLSGRVRFLNGKIAIFTQAQEGPVNGRLLGGRLVLECANAFTVEMVNRPEVLAIIARKASAMLKKPMQVVAVDKSEQPKRNANLDQLLNFGREHSDIISIKE